MAATCTQAGVGGPFSLILWMCADGIDKKECAELAINKAKRKGLTVTKNIVCKCPYGAEGEDFSNEKFEILPRPTSTLLTCKKGDLDSEENGGAYKDACSHDEDQYCYMASCAKGNNHVMTVWNCSPDTNCIAISAKVEETVNATVTCECRFGKANANLANENFTLPMVPTTTTQKPTTTTGKPTTTMDKRTTKADKVTPAADKPTTRADKPTTSADKSTNTTAEANVGVRAIIPVCSGVLMSIDMLTDVLEGTGLGATYGSAGGGWGVLIVGYGGLLYGVAKHDFTYEDCVAMLRACSQKWATCVLAKKDRNHEDICCGTGYVFTCYNDWKNDILGLLREWFPAYREKLENEERMIKQTGDIADVMRSKTHCEPEKYCGSCGNKYSCVETSMTYDGTACCEKGTTMECCVTTTTTTTTPTTTTTTRATTTTTDENLRCKKAFYESHPTEGDKYTEKLNQACGRNDQYCYVFNCTTVLPSIEGYIGFRAEWGCSASKTAFEDNFKKGKGHANSTCVSFVGSKYSDNSNHDKNALLPSSNVSTLWCEGGHFWKKRHHGKTITVCSKHEHYCYVLNCTLELRGKADSFQPKHYVLTQWGCTDKKPAELILDTKLIAKTAAGRILTQTCSRYVGKANVSRTNAGITVPTPAKECKKAYRSKLRAYNESSDQLCGQSQRYCYVLNCSTAVEGGNQPEIMTEWGCTNSLYKTADFREGKGRQLDEAYSVGPIPNNSVCRSSVGIFSNVGIMLPLLISTSNSSNSTLKCKRSRITSGGITDDHEECAAGDIVCYAVSCSNGKPILTGFNHCIK
ncbi:hypothetical protein GPALN_003181 [Globodera pallida]|nr:hypothetical protein GPALN_003181 [Globodera pallida]